MYNNFNEFYNETYNNFFNSCDHKELISSNPIPYYINEDSKIEGQYLNGIVTIKNSSIDTDTKIRNLISVLYHEFTHYYDESLFKHFNYSDEDIKVLMLTFSEIHASYNEMFAFFNLKNLSIKKRIDINKTVFKNQTLSQFCAHQISNQIRNMNNVLGFKYAMYLLGEKRAMLKIAKDALTISRIYNFKQIPEFIREEIVNIDKLINLNSYENIDVEQININKLEIEIKLTRTSIKNIPLPDIEGLDDIKKIINTL